MSAPRPLNSAIPDDLKVSELTVGELKMLIWEVLQVALAQSNTVAPPPPTTAPPDETDGSYDAW